MDVRLSGEQQALRDAAEQLVARLGPTSVRELEDAERAEKLGAAVEATGWRSLRAAGEGGAPLASGVEAALVAEQLARGAADIAFLGPVLAADLRRRAGSDADASGETVAVTADLADVVRRGDGPWGRPGKRLGDGPGDRPRERLGDGPWDRPGHRLVDGVADTAVAVDAAGATSALLLVAGPGGYEVGSVRVADALGRVDLTRGAATVDASSVVRLPDATRSLTDDDVRAWTALGLALTSADLVGAMHGALNLACNHARTRKQYGTAIGSFQAIQHLLADAHALIEGARSATLHSAWAVDALSPADALGAAAVAKAYAARASRTVGETVIQVHGGIGNTWECLAHVYVRRALVSVDLFGGVGANLERVLEHRGVGSAHGLR